MNKEQIRQKKVAVVGDYTGYGRCSLAVSLPILSVLGIQGCPLPSSVFSNHTGFPTYFFDDYTGKMDAYIAEWERLGLLFDGILIGFLGSARQTKSLLRLIGHCLAPGGRVILDPVLGDNGRMYATCTPQLCESMKSLLSCADLVTPNLTEAALLTGRPFRASCPSRELTAMAQELRAQGAKEVVISGVPLAAPEEGDVNFCLGADGSVLSLPIDRVDASYCGTGDIFAALLAAGAVQGESLQGSVQRAADFVRACVLRSAERGIPAADGVCFEELLGTLLPHGDQAEG